MATFRISNSAQLNTAIGAARAGDTLLLAGGDYGLLDLNGNKNSHLDFSSTVTIRSANPDDPAIFDGLKVRETGNVSIENVRFDFVTDAGTGLNATPFRVDSSSGIAIRDSVFDGDNFKGSDAAHKGFGTGFGLRIIGSQDVTLEGLEFSTFETAVSVTGARNVILRGSEFRDMSGDATKFSNVQGMLIEDNLITQFRANPDNTMHRDMIQFLNPGPETRSTDVTVRGNVLDSGTGAWTQSVFINNEAVVKRGAGKSDQHQNVLVEDNLIYNSQLHGIYVAGTNGVVVRNNTVLHNTADGDFRNVSVPKINVHETSSNVEVRNNIVDSITNADSLFKRTDWKMSDNLFVQRTDPLKDNYYQDLFVAADRPGAPVEALQALPGGLIQKLGVGAEMTRFDSTPDSLTALARHIGDRGIHVFDASLTAGPGGFIGDAGKYVWDFGDGKMATGRIVTHDYAKPGDYDVTLTVTHDGKTDVFEAVARDKDPNLLSLRFSKGAFDDVSSYDTPVVLQGPDVPQKDGQFRLEYDNFAMVDRAQSAHLHALQDFTVEFDLQRDSASDGTGRIMMIRQSWVVEMTDDGKLLFEVTNDSGKTTELNAKTAIRDTAWHEISIAYDALNGRASITIDGKAEGSVAVSGPTPSMNSWGLVIGDPSRPGFNGNIREIDIVAGAAEASSGVREPDVAAPEPSPPASPSPTSDIVDLATISDAAASGNYQELADNLGLTVAYGAGDSGDNLVVADVSTRFNTATAKGGNNVLIGADADSWLVDGRGDNVFFGGDGADDFRFVGKYAGGIDTIFDLDFGEGDRLILSGYEDRIFAGEKNSEGLNVFSTGGGAIVTSLDGLRELALGSDALSLTQDDDRFVLDIELGATNHLIQLDLIG
jgi:parallel beta-helix repeat protein